MRPTHLRRRSRAGLGGAAQAHSLLEGKEDEKGSGEEPEEDPAEHARKVGNSVQTPCDSDTQGGFSASTMAVSRSTRNALIAVLGDIITHIDATRG